MKFKSILISMLAVAALASCSKEEAGTTTPDNPDMKGRKAYLSVSIKLPKVAGTYAGTPGSDHGTVDERLIKKVLVVGFDASNNKVGVYDLNAAEQGTIGSNGTTAVHGDAFQVSDELAKIFVVINPTSTLATQITTATTYTAMNQAITESVDLMTDASSGGTGFMMTSAGVANGDHGLKAVTPSIAASESAGDITAAKTAAEGSPADVNVDRAMAKVTLSIGTTATPVVVENGTIMNGAIAWALSATNKQYYPYAELAAGYTGQGKYREDPNFVGSTMADLDWVENSSLTINTIGSPLITDWHLPAVTGDPRSFYALENTMEAATQTYGNTTKALIALRYTPTVTPAITPGDSWFRVNGVIKTLAQLDADYTAAKAASPQNTSLMAGYEAFLDAVLGTSRTIGWTDEAKGSVVAIADLDAIANGGYKAAKATTHMIEYFQKSVCFYSVDINHDEDLPGFTLGRWGIVRNNSYTITVTKISKPGLPYTPDPTDPDITDPENPAPTDPSDEQSAFISVSITVNPWTTWNQNVEL